MKTELEENKERVLFEDRKIRRIEYKNEWYYSIIDIIEVLSESSDPETYWRKLKQRLSEEESEVVTFCHGLKLLAKDGKMKITDCGNRETTFRIIQSILK